MKLLLTFILFPGLLWANSIRTVRFWEGKNNNKNLESHIKFIETTLAPGTVTAGIGFLENYVVYLPTNKKLPGDAELTELPFSEAATPTYTNRESYNAKNKATPEYGPIHFLENGFDKDLSYSSTPKVFLPNEELIISSKKQRVAYDLRAYSQLTPEATLGGELVYSEVDWKAGNTVVWLQLKKNGVPEADYLKNVKEQFAFFTSGVEGIDGHLARVDQTHVLHFINVTQKSEVKNVLERISYIQENIGGKKLLSFELIVAKNLAPFASGWGEAHRPGSAINVQFPSPDQIKK